MKSSSMWMWSSVGLLVLLSNTAAFGQDTGIPPFSTQDFHQYDTIDLANLNVNLAIPLRNKPTVGSIPFSSSFVGNPGLPNFAGVFPTMRLNLGGKLAWQKTVQNCGDPNHPTATYVEWNGFSYVDPSGTPHSFSSLDLFSTRYSYPACQWTPNTDTQLADDRSGWTLYGSVSGTSSGTFYVYDPSGNRYDLSGDTSGTLHSITDPNGNPLTVVTTGQQLTNTVISELMPLPSPVRRPNYIAVLRHTDWLNGRILALARLKSGHRGDSSAAQTRTISNIARLEIIVSAVPRRCAVLCHLWPRIQEKTTIRVRRST